MTNEKQPPAVSRRTFMSTAAAAAGITIVPRHVLGGTGIQAPSDTVNVAVVGYSHGMGTSNLMNVAKSDNIVALCDCDTSEAAKAAMATRGTLEKFPKAVLYKDWRQMLEKQKDIEAVVVATPDHNHAVIAMAAMQAGKHVYVQKPLTRTVSEARALTEAARKYNVVTQMGNQGHSEEGLRLMQEWLAAGAIGAVREVHCWTNRPVWPQGMPRPTDTPAVPDGLDWDLWIGPAPMRPYNRAYHPFCVARLAGLRCRRHGRHGLPCHGRGLHDPQARRAHERDRGRSVQRPAAAERRRGVRPARGVQRQLSPGLDHPLVVPAARRHAARQAALVRRRHPAGATRRSRAGEEPAGVGHDLRRR